MRRSGSTLAELKLGAVREIDAEAEGIRQSVITAGAGQAMAYDEKLREAEHFMSPEGGPPENYPHLVAEAAVELPPVTVAVKAMQIIGMAQQWRMISSRIEALRIGRHVAIAAVTAPAELRALPPIDWQSVFA